MNQHVVVLSTGGTIASARDASGRNAAGALSGETLVQHLALPSSFQVDVHSVFQKPSNALTGADLLALRERCLACAADPAVAGIVITHGTDTLEDTAYFLQSTLPHAICPVVITGSQRAPHAAGTDAYVNLAVAIRVATSAAARGLGVLVSFNESIYSANSARKMNTFQLHTFEAPGYGQLGYVDGERVCIVQKPVLPATLIPGAVLPRVDLLAVALDSDPALIRAAAKTGARGIVLDAVGRGHVPPSWVPLLRDAIAKGAAVVVASSCLVGPVAQAYEFEGSLFSLEQIGAVPAPDLSARKARMRLMAWLSCAKPRMALRDLYAT
jgi:L-asparaginase